MSKKERFIERFTADFKAIAENLADIYQIMTEKDIDTDILNKPVSNLYNVLNKLENEFIGGLKK